MQYSFPDEQSRNGESTNDSRYRTKQTDNACQIPSSGSNKGRARSSEDTASFNHHAPSIFFTHDTALKAGNDQLFNLDENGQYAMHSLESQVYNHPAPPIDDPSHFLKANLNSVHADEFQSQYVEPYSSSGLPPELLTILDPARGDFTRRLDEKAAVELRQQKLIRQGLQEFPPLLPLSQDVAHDLMVYQKSMERFVVLILDYNFR